VGQPDSRKSTGKDSSRNIRVRLVDISSSNIDGSAKNSTYFYTPQNVNIAKRIFLGNIAGGALHLAAQEISI
jgi:hypothetical protein